MCGICGIVHSDREFLFGDSMLTAMRDSMFHRGPDDEGSYISRGIALGARRLSIIDLSPNGHMPMHTQDGRYNIVYNGEIYNYRELRKQLVKKGCEFHSHTDTEVLLHLYAEMGAEMLGMLNGMFAFAIWDNQERTVFIARDRLGIKPLVYAVKDGALYFASEEKALFAAGVPAQFDPLRWEELLCFRHVAGENTLFAGVKRLLPGHYLLWNTGKLAITRWWNLSDRVREQRASVPENLDDWYRTTFDSSIDYRRISDVPVGVMLSGGLDSSAVAATLALQAGDKVSSFTVRFEEAAYDEGQYALDVAQQYRLDYNALTVSPKSDLIELIRDASWLLDAPLAHGNDPHMLALSRYAKPKVTVLLSGEGADETLGGYVRYRPLMFPTLYRMSKPFAPMFKEVTRFNHRVHKLMRFASNGGINSLVLYNTCDVLPTDIASLGIEISGLTGYRRQVLEEAQALYPRDYLRQAMYCDQHIFLCSLLDRNDRMTMGASIECRVPFLDYRLVEGVASLPTHRLVQRNLGKAMLRNALGSRLPKSVLGHRKWGFGVPWSQHLRQIPEFRDVLERLHTQDIMLQSPFKPSQIQEVVRNFVAGDDTWSSLVRQWTLMTIWHEVVTDRTKTMSVA